MLLWRYVRFFSFYFMSFSLSFIKKNINRQKGNKIFDEFPFMLWHHTNKQNIDYCNKAYADMLGQDVETVLLKKENFFPAKEAANVFQKAKKTRKVQKIRLSKIIEGERHVFDLWERKDSEGGSWVLGIDVSEDEKNKENTKQESKAFEKIFNHLSVSLCIFSKTQKLIHFNRAFLDLFRFDEQRLSQALSFEDFFDELRNRRLLPEVVDFASYKKIFLRFFKEDKLLHKEILHLPDERSLRLTIAPYALGGLVMLFEDITEHLILERKNNTMIAVHNALINHLQEGVLIFGVDHRLSLINDFCSQLWGLRHSFGEGEHLNQLLHKTKDFFDCGKNWSLFKENILEGVTNRSPRQGIIHRKDGISLKFHYIPLPNGEHLITYQDVTDSFKFQEIFEEATRLFDITQSMKPQDFKQKISLKHLIESALCRFQALIKEKNVYILTKIGEESPICIADKKILSYFVHILIGYALQECPIESRLYLSLFRIEGALRLSLAYRIPLLQEELYQHNKFNLILIKKLAALCAGDVKLMSRNKRRLRIFCDFSLQEEALEGCRKATCR